MQPVPLGENLRSSGRRVLRVLRRLPLERALYLGRAHYCPLCRSHLRRFLTGGTIPRPNAQCPVCGSFERHRLDWLYLTRRTNLLDGAPRRMLHIAPERSLAARLRTIPALEYLSAGLTSPPGQLRMDITRLGFASGTFDVIYCSHVLEHISEDRRALHELYRVLAPGGWALLKVPIEGETTREDHLITDPEARLRLYGHPGHVRGYGLDFTERIAEAGFRVSLTRASELLAANERALCAIPDDPQCVFYCEKQKAQDER